MLRFLLVAVLLLSAALPAQAASSKKVAILEVRTVGTFDPKAVQGLATFIASEAEKFNLRVMAGTDLQAVIGFEKQKVLLGCSDGACLAEIGGSLGVDYLLASEVSEVGGIWLLTLTLIDVIKSAPVKRVSKKVRRVADMVDNAQAATAEALAQFPARATEKPGAAAGAVSSGATSSTRTAGIVLDVAGAALLVGGAVSGTLALLDYNQAKTASAADLPGLKSKGKAEAWTADILYGVGAAALVTGLILTFTGSSAPDVSVQAPAVSAVPLPGGGAITVSGRFQ